MQRQAQWAALGAVGHSFRRRRRAAGTLPAAVYCTRACQPCHTGAHAASSYCSRSAIQSSRSAAPRRCSNAVGGSCAGGSCRRPARGPTEGHERSSSALLMMCLLQQCGACNSAGRGCAHSGTRMPCWPSGGSAGGAGSRGHEQTSRCRTCALCSWRQGTSCSASCAGNLVQCRKRSCCSSQLNRAVLDATHLCQTLHGDSKQQSTRCI